MAGGLQPPSEEEEKKAAAAKQQGVIFILENASLEVARVGKVSCASVHLSSLPVAYVLSPTLLADTGSLHLAVLGMEQGCIFRGHKCTYLRAFLTLSANGCRKTRC